MKSFRLRWSFLFLGLLAGGRVWGAAEAASSDAPVVPAVDRRRMLMIVLVATKVEAATSAPAHTVILRRRATTPAAPTSWYTSVALVYDVLMPAASVTK
jgi:hypothetical protein